MVHAGRILTVCCILLLAGCAAPIVYVQPADVRECPPLEGVVKVSTFFRSGTGVVVAERDGWWYALTAKHVLGTVLVVDGEAGLTCATDPTYDVALVQFQSRKTYPIRRIVRPHLGQTCWAIGYPHGGPFVHRGTVSRLTAHHVYNDAGTVGGFSGGPLLDAHGNILGLLIDVKVDASGPLWHIGRAVHARHLRELVEIALNDPLL